MKFKSRKAVVLCFVVLAAVLAVLVLKHPERNSQESAGVWRSAAGEEEFRVGVLAPKEGAYAAYGESIEHGAAAAAEVINASGGILRRPVRLRLIDTKSNPEAAARGVAELAEWKAALVVGTAAREETLAAVRAAAAVNLPFIYVANGPAMTCSAAEAGQVSPYVWGAGATPDMLLEPFLIYLGQKVPEPERDAKFYYFFSDTPQTREVAANVQTAAEALGYRTVAVRAVDERIRDYYQDIRDFFVKQPDVLFLSLSQRAQATFIGQAAKQTVRKEMSIAGLDMLEEERVLQFGQAVDGYFTADRYSFRLDNPENKRFLAAWQKLYPEPAPAPTAVAAATYGAMLAAQAAYDNAGAQEPAAFRKAMENTQLMLPQGQVSVDAANHLFLQPIYAMKIVSGRYEVSEYLGDVSHPGLKGCAVGEVEKAPAKDEDGEAG